jgi:hypothetical protein
MKIRLFKPFGSGLSGVVGGRNEVMRLSNVIASLATEVVGRGYEIRFLKMFTHIYKEDVI